MSENPSIETTIYVDHGFEFPVEGGGELRVIDSKLNLYTGSFRVNVSFERIPKFNNDKGDLLRVIVKAPDNKGRIWRAEHIMYPLWLFWKNTQITYFPADAGPLVNGGPANPFPWEHFRVIPLVENVEINADDRDDLPLLFANPGSKTKDGRYNWDMYFGQLRIKYFSADFDLFGIEHWRDDRYHLPPRLCLQLKSNVDADLHLISQGKGKHKPKQTLSLDKIGALTGVLTPGAFLLQQHNRLIHEEGGADEGAWIGRSIPVPVTFHPTDETAEPCQDLVHEPE